MALQFVPARPYDMEDREYDDQEITGIARGTKSVLWKEFKINLGSANEVPRDQAGVPRILLVGKNENGAPILRDPNEVKILPGSKEFAREMAKGNVLVFPAGKQNPVQLNGSYNTEDGVRFSCTEELQPGNSIPQPRPKRMGFWRGLARVFSFGLAFRGRARQIRQEAGAHNAMLQKLQDYRTRRNQKLLDDELKEVTDLEAARKQAAIMADKQQKLDLHEKELREKTEGVRNFLSMVGPKPVFLEQLEEGNEKCVNGYQGIYTKDTFKDLTVFTKDADELNAQQEKQMQAMSPEEKKKYKPVHYVKFDQSKILIGPKKVPLSDETFASLAMFNCYRSDLAVSIFPKASTYDPTLSEALKNLGYKPKEIDSIIAYNGRNIAASDLFMHLGREREGSLFKDYTNKGRLMAAEAFQAYAGGDKTKLAALVANAITENAREYNMCEGNRFGYNKYGSIYASKHVLQLMKDDPELESLAVQKYGLDPKNIQLAKGMTEIEKLEQKDREAVRDLAKNIRNAEPLSAEKKREMAEQIVAGRLVMQQLDAHGFYVSDTRNGFIAQKTKDLFIDSRNLYTVPKDQWTAPPKGKIHEYSEQTINGAFGAIYGPKPQIAFELAEPNGPQKIKNMAKEIVAREGLDQLEPEQLYEQLNPVSGKFKLSEAVQRHTDARQMKGQEPEKTGPVEEKQKLNQNEDRQFGGPGGYGA